MRLESKNQEMELSGETVVISKSGVGNALAGGLNGGRSISIRSITSIQLKPAGCTAGYILFSYPGSKPFRGGLIEAAQDPDAFLFDKSLNYDVESFKAKVEKIMQTPLTVSGSALSLGDELSKLADMLNRGLLTQAEFEAGKKKLLA